MKRKGKLVSAVGCLGFFLLVAGIITVALLVYGAADRALAGNTGLIAVVMLVVVFFLSLVCVLVDIIRRRMQVERPVEKILQATERITAGDFSVRMETAHPYGQFDEYDCIIDNLNKMAAELSKTEMLRNDFVSNVSHELKTPLAIIQNYSAALQSDALDAQTRRKYAAVLVSASGRLTALITNILKLDRLENQEIRAEKVRFRLDEALAQCILQWEDKIEQKQLDLRCDLAEVTVESDPNYLEIVWNNLLSNAVKFTPPQGSIGVSVRVEQGSAVVEVSDTGCGISKETGKHIFDKFYQGDTSHAQEGNGLGLALVKKVIEILGGEISVESEPGKGSTFTVKLRGAAE